MRIWASNKGISKGERNMSEVRLIDANALKYKNLAEVNGKLTYVLTAEEVNNAPTVTNGTYEQGFRVGAYGRLDEIRPQGEWIKECDSCDCSNCYNSGARFTRKDCSGRCSNCGELQCCTDNFCPNCGAKMVNA